MSLELEERVYRCICGWKGKEPFVDWIATRFRDDEDSIFVCPTCEKRLKDDDA